MPTIRIEKVKAQENVQRLTTRKTVRTGASPNEDGARALRLLLREVMDPYWSWRFMRANRP